MKIIPKTIDNDILQKVMYHPNIIGIHNLNLN